MITSLLALFLSLSFAQTFETSCYVAGEDDQLQSSVQIEGDQWTQTHRAYTDEHCQQTYLVFQIKSTATIVNSNLDLKIQEVAYTSTLDSVTRALNEIAYCNRQNWETQVRQIVTGEQCQDYAVPKFNEVVYSLIDLQDKNVLRLGVTSPHHDGSSSEKRHLLLDTLLYYRK